MLCSTTAVNIIQQKKVMNIFEKYLKILYPAILILLNFVLNFLSILDHFQVNSEEKPLMSWADLSVLTTKKPFLMFVFLYFSRN